ncbi:palmitoyl acyltransferase 1 [Novymonas esmeraldas]|uniref:Palmitoyl acyltransferase 1 n=1 Tax=Novymonas esmeraldas TaxID=1808958 RepID=A0AAW0FB51_9TRYP
MRVFHEAVEKNRGPLPLVYYLQPDAGATPDSGAAQHGGDGDGVDGTATTTTTATVDLLHTRVDRRTFFECVLNDADFAILTTFMMSGVPIDATRDEDGASALHIAAAGSLEMLHSSNSSSSSSSAGGAGGVGGASAPSNGSGGGSTSSTLNSLCKNQLILSFLIDNGADVNAAMRGGYGQTPLMVAAARQNLRVVKLLLAKGADMRAQDTQGRTVLSYAVAYPVVLETLRMWMGEQAFDVAATQERLLHTACRTSGNAFVALYLIEQVGMSVNTRDTGDRDDDEEGNKKDISDAAVPASPLASLSSPQSSSGARSPRRDYRRSRSPATSSSFLAGDTTTDGNRQQQQQQQLTTRVHVSGPVVPPPRSGSVAAMHSPVSADALHMRALHDGNTPLHCAVSTADVALVRALLSKGADLHAANESGVSPFQLAQSQSSLAQSWRQYWKDELILLLRPASASAAAARRRHAELQQGKCPRQVRALLTAYNRADSAAARQELLRDRPAQYLWQLCTPMDVVYFAAAATLPHVAYYICCLCLSNFFLLLCPLPVLYASFVGTQRRDSSRRHSRPLAGLGWSIGYVAVQSLCLPLFTTYYYYKYYSYELEDHRAISLWLVPSAVVTAVLAVYVVLLSSPGLVTSAEGQRKGIYANLRSAKGEYTKELLYGVDLRTMVRKPLRAQFSPQLQHVVLRYHQFCGYLSTIVGGGNHRAFFWLHVALLWLLSCFYFYAREYSRLMSGVATVARSSVAAGAAAAAANIRARGGVSVAAAAELDSIVMERFASAPFATAERRFAYMYSQVVLPLMMLMTAWAVYTQLCVIARNLTFYDLDHGDDESSVYCFALGDTLYSLYDGGKLRNLREFFGWTALTTQTYRVPQMNAYLQQLVEDHQRWQLTGGDACCDQHGHQHHAGASVGTTTVAAAAAHESSDEATTTGEKVGPAEWGDDESARAQHMLLARQQQALAAAAASANAGRPHHARESQHLAVHTPTPTTTTTTAAVPAAAAAEKVAERDGEADGGGDDAGDVTALAAHIFQEMIRNGGSSGGGGGGGADTQMQREWDAAVAKARQMYVFYMQSMGGGEED